MNTPTRVVNKHRASTYDIYIGRGSMWGNPFVIGKDGTRDDVIRKYRDYFEKNDELKRHVYLLKGKTLACFCAPQACHGDILAEYADRT